MTADPVRAHARRRPADPALVTPRATWSWADLDARVDRAASGVAAVAEDGPAGVGRALAVVAPTGPELVAVFWGAWRAGVTLVPLSTRWPASALRGALDRLGLTCVVASEAAGGLDAVPLADVVRGRAGAGEQHARGMSETATIVHTSGSSGEPKAALHSVGNHIWSARGVADALHVSPASRWLLDLPMHHVGGLGVVVRCGLVGATLAVPDPGTPTADAVRQLAPTHASLVSTQLRRLLDAGVDGAPLRAVLLGGSAMPPALLDEAAQRGLPLVASYGLTEMTSTVTATALGAGRPTTSGRLLPHRALRIAPGGEIEVGGRTRCLGYVSAYGVERPFDADGWFATGDLGAVDETGALTVTGRIGRRFVSGGENVQPEAIEAALGRLPDVAEAAVVAVPDGTFGWRPVAFVRTASGSPPAGLADALRASLPGFMVPARVVAWEGAGGMKPDLAALADRARQTHGGAPPPGDAPPEESRPSV